MSHRTQTFCTIALLVSARGLADDPSLDCRSPRGTIEINRCDQQEFETQDRLLNEVYQKVLAQLKSAGKTEEATRERLISAQRLWIQFRNADCDARESVYDGGSVHTSVYLQCLRDHTAQRIKDLDPRNWQGG
jgi:uncharacterized protein YecT (DUF1311 family)